MTLWEAMYRRRPFRGSSPLELEAAKRKGPPPRPSSRVPEWVHSAIARGLAVDPDKRWPSVDALVEALASGRDRARRRKVVAGVAVAGAAGLAFIAWHRWDESARVGACEEEGDAIAEVWNEAAAEAMTTALAGTGVPHAEATAQRVRPWLDDHAKAWADARTSACMAANVEGRWDADTLDRAIWCLEARRLDFAKLIEQLSSGERRTTNDAVPAAAGLASVDPCVDAETLARLPAPPTENREAIQALRPRLSEAYALERTGAVVEGLPLAEEVAREAEAAGWKPLAVKAQARVVRLRQVNGKYTEARALAERAYFEAMECGALEVALELAEKLVYVVGFIEHDKEAAMLWAQHADLVRARLPDRSGMLEARSLGGRGVVLQAAGEYDAARELQERALALYEAGLNPQHPLVALGCTNVGRTLRMQGEYAAAQAHMERALRIQEEVLGPEHPDLGSILNNLANVHTSAGAPEKAQPLLEHAIEIQEAALGKDHPEVAMALNNLANHYANAGRNEDATRMYKRTLRILEKVLGQEHPDVATTLNNIALALEDPVEAKALHERALEIRLKVLGADHDDVAQSLYNLAFMAEQDEEFARAQELNARALAIREEALGAEHPKVADTLVAAARVALAQGHKDDAIAAAQRAVKILETAGRDATEAKKLLAEAQPG